MPSVAGRVVVAGYGAGGRGVCLVLEAAQIPFLAVDQDLDRLRLARQLGHEVRYADLTDPTLLTTLDVDRARLSSLGVEGPKTDSILTTMEADDYAAMRTAEFSGPTGAGAARRSASRG